MSTTIFPNFQIYPPHLVLTLIAKDVNILATVPKFDAQLVTAAASSGAISTISFATEIIDVRGLAEVAFHASVDTAIPQVLADLVAKAVKFCFSTTVGAAVVIGIKGRFLRRLRGLNGRAETTLFADIVATVTEILADGITKAGIRATTTAIGASQLGRIKGLGFNHGDFSTTLLVQATASGRTLVGTFGSGCGVFLGRTLVVAETARVGT